MYSNNILNFQESTTILNAHTKKVWKLIVFTSYLYIVLNNICLSMCVHLWINLFHPTWYGIMTQNQFYVGHEKKQITRLVVYKEYFHYFYSIDKIFLWKVFKEGYSFSIAVCSAVEKEHLHCWQHLLIPVLSTFSFGAPQAPIQNSRT